MGSLDKIIIPYKKFICLCDLKIVTHSSSLQIESKLFLFPIIHNTSVPTVIDLYCKVLFSLLPL